MQNADRKKNEGIQMLRGIACLMVVLSHYVASYDKSNWLVHCLNIPILRLFWDGNAAVDCFFVLSGFFYFDTKASSYQQRVSKRLIRLYPCYLLSIIFGIMARIFSWRGTVIRGSQWINSQWSDALTSKEIFKGIVFFPTFDALVINGVLWTMKVELAMVFILPVLLVTFKKLSDYWWAGIIGCVILAICFNQSSYFGFLFFIPEFALGMVVKKRIVYFKKNYRIVAALAGIVMIYVRWLISPNMLEWKCAELIINIITAIGWCLIIPLFYHADIKRNLLSIVGDYSYYIYLTHFVVLLWFRWLFDATNYGVFVLAAIMSTVIVAFIFNKFDFFVQRRIKK